MIIHDVLQNSEEWHRLRCGVFTASVFSKIVTPTGKYSAQAEDIEDGIVAEIITGTPSDDFGGTKWVERGKELEGDAVKLYEMLKDCEVKHMGFVTNDDGNIGCSPDGCVGDDGLIEIKCPKPKTHVKYCITGVIEDVYKPQIQGQMLVTGRKYVDIISYHPEMKPAIIRVERDEEYIEKLSNALNQCIENVNKKLEIMRN